MVVKFLGVNRFHLILLANQTFCHKPLNISFKAIPKKMLATEVTPGLLAGAEPDAHQFYVTVVFYG
jgi:hypothetical protein